MKYQSGQLIKIKDFGEYVITDNLEEENTVKWRNIKIPNEYPDIIAVYIGVNDIKDGISLDEFRMKLVEELKPKTELFYDADGNELHLEDVLGTPKDLVSKGIEEETEKAGLPIVPIIIIVAIVGSFTILFLLADMALRRVKRDVSTERTMEDGELVRRLLQYAKPYKNRF